MTATAAFEHLRKYKIRNEQLEQMYESVNKANKNIWKNKSEPDEFHDAVVRYIVDNFNDRKYIY